MELGTVYETCCFDSNEPCSDSGDKVQRSSSIFLFLQFNLTFYVVFDFCKFQLSLNILSLLNCVSCVLKLCSRAKVPCVLMCSRVLCAYMFTCQCALRAYVLTCLRALRAYVLTSQRVLRACVLTCERAVLNNVNSYIIQIC